MKLGSLRFRRPQLSRLEIFVVAALFVGLAVRLVINAYSIGSDDATTWESFAKSIREHGLFGTYRKEVLFNHPPLMGLLARASLGFADTLGLRFQPVFKLPMVLADVASGVIVWLALRRQAPKLAAAGAIGCALNPVGIMVSAHHGNTDALCAMFVVAAAALLNAERWMLAGLAFGAAINVKLIPAVILLGPTLFIWKPRNLVRWFAGLALAAIPFLPPVIGIWPEFKRNVLEYNSFPSSWGFPMLVRQSRKLLRWLPPLFKEYYVPNARYLIMAGAAAIGALAYRTKRRNAFEVCAASMCLFMILSPGFGAQYTVYPVALVFACRPGLAWRYVAMAGLLIGLMYYQTWTGTWPAYTLFRKKGYPEIGASFGLLGWATLIAFVWETYVRRNPHPPPGQNEQRLAAVGPDQPADPPSDRPAPEPQRLDPRQLDGERGAA